MATKSIFKNVNITNKKSGRAFVKALDSSKAAKDREIKPRFSCREITGEQIKVFFDQRHLGEYIQINLSDILEQLGEDRTNAILSDFSCPLNKDVEFFLHKKAIEFSKQDLSKTHLVYYVDKTENDTIKHLVGYFTIKTKYIKLSKNALSNGDKRKFSKHGTYDEELKKYIIPVVLIGQLAKNYTNNSNSYITGDILLQMALDKIRYIQSLAGGKYVYPECEEIPQLHSFYKRNGFRPYGKRILDGDESNLYGKYLIQLLKYL